MIFFYCIQSSLTQPYVALQPVIHSPSHLSSHITKQLPMSQLPHSEMIPAAIPIKMVKPTTSCIQITQIETNILWIRNADCKGQLSPIFWKVVLNISPTCKAVSSGPAKALGSSLHTSPARVGERIPMRFPISMFTIAPQAMMKACGHLHSVLSATATIINNCIEMMELLSKLDQKYF